MLLNLESSKKALAQSEKESAWREMAKQVAHEIKNPLTPMKLTLQQLERRMQSDHISKENLQRMLQRTISSLLQQIDTLSDIATSFSTFAKMPSPRLAPFDIADTLRNIIELHRSQNKKVFFLTNIAPGTFKVMGDDRLTGRILTNLILNAIQAVPEERTPQIMVSLYRTENNMIRIEVRDNGSGIPEEIRKRIFTPSFTTKASGSGIGLAVAKRGIEQMNGRIWFESKEGEGTCFFIELPPLS
jgi:nitrogen fixation/metabolism regulation signal transduction histidine kinase